MKSDLRKTGISVVGDLPWGAHFCFFYETKQDLLDVLIPYFKTGLENKEFCLWVISNSELLTVEEAMRALRNALPDLDRYVEERSIEVFGHEDWFLRGKTFDSHTVANRFRKKLNEALARGYAGMRVNGSPAWLHDAGPQELRKFEAELDKLFPNERTIASCTYPLASIGGEDIFDVVRIHQFAIARRQGEWEVLETPELIQAKAEIRRLNEELEQRVIERTNELVAANEALKNEISERSHAEALLHAKEQEFRAIVENAPDQIIRYDREFRRTYVNPAVLKAYGLPAENLIGKPVGSVIQDAGLEVKAGELAELRQLIAAVFDTGKLYEYEMSWPAPAGRRYYSVRLFPELDLNGSTVNVLAISRDITERRIAAEELKKEKEILEKIFDNIPVMIGFVGEDSRVKLVNPEWERTIGWTLKELQEQDVDIFAEAYPDPVYRHQVLDFVTASTGEWVDLKIRVRTGQVIDAACAVVHLSDGTRVAIAQDITERKRAEEHIRATSEQLRALSAKLQSAKEEEDIRIAREIHDEMGSTLTSLRWELDRVGKVISEAEDWSQLQELGSKIAEMIRLTDVTIGTMRRIASELRPSILDDLGLPEALEWQAQQFQTRTGIICRCDCSLENIEFDPEQSTAIFRIFQEALTNVLSHAEATTVEVEARSSDGEFVLTIRDNGKGITEDEKSNRLSLGILGMQERAHLIGGKLEISGTNEGTVLTVRIPISDKANR
jgi:PAS domain S-box-containing protein